MTSVDDDTQFLVRPLHLDDLPAVMALERSSFSVTAAPPEKVDMNCAKVFL
jgi:hypothetical protein